jgi:hypothetical protein
VLQLGGQVSFDDGPDCGTIFNVELPEWNEARDAKPALLAANDCSRIAS